MLRPNRFDFLFLSCLQLTFCQPRIRLPSDRLGKWLGLTTHRVLVLVVPIILLKDPTRPFMKSLAAVVEAGDEVLAVAPDDDLRRL